MPTIETLRLRFEIDGQVFDEEVSTDFDIDPSEMAYLLLTGGVVMDGDDVSELTDRGLAGLLFVKLRLKHPEFGPDVFQAICEMVAGLEDGSSVVVE